MPSSTKSAPTPKKGSPVIFIVLTLAILAAGGFFVYQYTQKGTAGLGLTMPGSPGTAKLTEAMFADIDDPLIRKHYVAQYSMPAYRVKSTSSGLGVDTENVMTYVMSEPFKLQMTTRSAGRLVSDTIDIGDTTFVYDVKTSTWYKQTVKAKPEDLASRIEDVKPPKDAAAATEFASKLTHKKLGEEACGGLTCYKYEEVSSDYPEGKRTIWFDKEKLLLRREQNGFGEFTSTMTYEYDGVTVTTPAGAKEVPEGKSIYDFVSPAEMSAEDAENMLKKYDKSSGGKSVGMPANDSTDVEEMVVEESYGEEGY